MHTLLLLAADLTGALPLPTRADALPRAVQQAGLQPGSGVPVFADRAGGFGQLAQDARAAVDAGLAELILSTATAPAEALAPATAGADLAWRLRPLAAQYGPSGGLAGQTTQQLGSSDGLAVLFQHEIDGSATINNAVRVSHARGPVTAQVAVIGRVPMFQGQPVALSYRSSTSIAVLPFFTVGADAHGPLGTLSAIRPGLAESVVEPHLKLTLPVLGATAGASTGWRLPTGPAVANDPDKRTEFHWKLTIQKKL